jgi:hypothetical protein
LVQFLTFSDPTVPVGKVALGTIITEDIDLATGGVGNDDGMDDDGGMDKCQEGQEGWFVD